MLMTNKQITKLYNTLFFIFATISLIAAIKLLYAFYFFVQNYLSK
jgi:hypothetical protein